MTIYRGLNGVNREAKKQFRGMGGINREVKAQYRGSNGVNRKVFVSKEHLYNVGDEAIGLTGGWVVVREGASGAYGTVIKNAGNMYMNAVDRQTWCYVQLYTRNLINVSNYTKLKCRLDVSSTRYAALIFAINTMQAHVGANMVAMVEVTYVGTDMTIEIDISDVSGSYYVEVLAQGLNGSGYNTQTEAKVYEIWLE